MKQLTRLTLLVFAAPLKLSFIVFAILLAPSIARAADIATGMSAMETGDLALALKNFRPLAEEGDPTAQFWLGMIYYSEGIEGKEEHESEKEAVKWLSLSAQQGNAMGQITLSQRYFNGEGVPQDYVMAHMWLNIAMQNGMREQASQELARFETRMSRDQIADAQRLARECARKNYKDC